MMTYEEAVEFLNAPKYSETRPGLGPVTELMERLGNPQDQLEYVHIAGTNGKGSTAAYMDSVLRAAGYRTGLYTSPFLEQFNERIRVNGEGIGNEELARITTRVRDAVEQMEKDGSTAPTIFEMVTAVAFLYFLERQCDIVVLEVGMGGRCGEEDGGAGAGRKELFHGADPLKSGVALWRPSGRLAGKVALFQNE